MADQGVDLELLMPCDIEEAYERRFVQVKHAAEFCPPIFVKTVAQNKRPPRHESGFGVGRKNSKFTPIH